MPQSGCTAPLRDDFPGSDVDLRLIMYDQLRPAPAAACFRELSVRAAIHRGLKNWQLRPVPGACQAGHSEKGPRHFGKVLMMPGRAVVRR
jgi:hypothetical protein